MSAPVDIATDRNVEAVRALLLERSAVGIAKYGVTTDRAGLSGVEWLVHLRAEMLDGAVYATALIKELQQLTARVEAACARLAEIDAEDAGSQGESPRQAGLFAERAVEICASKREGGA